MMPEDRVALVTGASRGIGRTAALRLGEVCARVCVNSLDDEKGADDVVSRLRERGVDSFQKQADVSCEDDVKALVAAVVARWGRIDVLVNNAGISGKGPSFLEMTGEAWDRMLRVNLKSVFLCCRTVLPHMMDAGHGRIVNISSIAGTTSLVACNAHYAAAKAGIIALTKRLARDFAGHGINVNCVAPGLVHDTGFNENMDEALLASYVAQVPKGRPGYTKDVAGIIAFLVSDEADFITGQVVVVDGGATC